MRLRTVDHMTARLAALDLRSLAHAVADDGIAAHEPAVAELVAAARSRGLCCTLVTVLAEPRAPSVARERALGRVIEALATGRSSPAHHLLAG